MLVLISMQNPDFHGIFFFFYNLKEKYGKRVEIKILVLLWTCGDVIIFL